jgi:DNA helicase II / ATP-dependent DNA helicase PcrA
MDSNLPENQNSKPQEESLEDRSGLLDSFLSKLSANAMQEIQTSSMEHTHISNELDNLNMLDYPEVEITNETEQKINQLVKIAEGIEDKCTSQALTLALPPQKQFKIDYTNALNHEQFQATLNLNGPMLVIAGAGTGKTRVIVHRLAFMLEMGVQPERILLLTFTRKAAKEMQTRTEQLLRDTSVSRVNSGTFHSFAATTLRKYANSVGLKPNFTIMDQPDAEDTIDLIRTELKYNSKDKRFPKKKRLMEIISSARNRNITVGDVIEKDFSGLIDYIADVELIFKGYTQYKGICGVYDFDDLMDILRDRLRDNPGFCQTVQESFDYVMVDEFQDTNVVQKEIVDLIAQKHRNLMVVGDDTQSIYSFRGANFENILRFPETYPDCKIVKIEQNYRSNKQILNFTNDIIRTARFGYRKELFSDMDAENLPIIRRFQKQEEEAEYIVSRIRDLIEKDVPLNQIAVLNRADWHNRYIQAELNKHDIPYVVVGGFKFNERKHVKDIIGYLRILFNPSDAVAWHRALKMVAGVGVVTAAKIIQFIMDEGGTISFESFEGKRFYKDLQKLQKALEAASNKRLSVAGRIEILKNYYAPILESREIDFKMRLLDLDVLIDLAAKYDDMHQLLTDFALDPPNKGVAGQPKPLIDEAEESGKVTLSTVHSSKGLEWHTVFVPHALDGMFPSNKAVNLEDMEEERRLFYVACSRAKDQLYVTFPAYVSSFNAYFTYPSRFLVELGKQFYTFERHESW